MASLRLHPWRRPLKRVDDVVHVIHGQAGARRTNHNSTIERTARKVLNQQESTGTVQIVTDDKGFPTMMGL